MPACVSTVMLPEQRVQARLDRLSPPLFGRRARPAAIIREDASARVHVHVPLTPTNPRNVLL